jgi:hypothetical protein
MANAMYTPYKVLLLTSAAQSLAEGTADVTALLVDAADYTFSAAHDFVDDVPSGARVATGALDSQTTTSGTFDAADETWTSVTGDVSEEVILHDNTGGAESTDPLIVRFDTFASGMPVTPNGGNITISWNASGIFSL